MHQPSRSLFPLITVLLGLFVSSVAAADGVRHTGIVQDRPGGLVGEWRIGEKTVHVSEETEFDDEHGGFNEGACVEVEGTWRENGTIDAATIESLPEGECEPEAEEIRFEGIIESLPGGEHIGEWEVGPKTVVVSGETDLNDEHGPFVVGACVVVEGLYVEGHVIAGGIATLPPRECGIEPEPEPFEFTGVIDELPGGNLLGEWVVDGRSVSVGEETNLSPEEGPFEEGACVEVGGFERENGSVEAISVRTEEPEECGIEEDEDDEGEDEDDGEGEDDDEGDEEDEDDGEDDHEIRFRGLIERLPEEGLLGKWVVKGRMVFVDEDTKFEDEHGPFVIGACVEVEGIETADGLQALKIESESLRECGRSDGPDFGIAPNGIEFSGRVDEMPPEGLFGEWIVNGQSVLVSRSTKIRIEKGIDFEGLCVEVRGSLSGSGDVRARSIESEGEGACLPGEALPKVKFEGPIQELPDTGLSGEWKVGGITVEASGDTEVDQDRGPATIGACVEVEGDLEPDNSILADEIEVVSSAAGCRHRKPDEVDEVSFLGVIQDLPDEGVVGEWQIAGRTVLVTSTTILDLPGDLEVEMCVKVKGIRLPDEAVLAGKITLAEFGACGGPPEPAELRLKGILHELPDLGLVGTWLVGDYVVHVAEDTKLEDEHGAFDEGACVRVLGRLKEDESVLARVAETEEPEECDIRDDEEPKEGPFEFLGKVETAPKSGVAKGTAGTWMIGKYAVTVDAGTSVDQTSGSLNLGSCVVVSGLPTGVGAFSATSLSVKSSSGTCFEGEGLVNAASFAADPVSPGEIVSIFGLAIGPPEDATMVVEDGRLTTELADTRVLFDGVAAPLIYVSANQINAIVPYSVAGQASTQVQVETTGAWSNIVTLDVAAVSPGVFTVTQSGAGQAAALNVEADGSLTVNNAANAVARGGVVVLYATGEGQTSPAGVDGEIVGDAPGQPVLPVTVSIGGIPAQVLYSGSAPGFVAGLLQVNAVVPAGVAPGSAVDVFVTVGSEQSQAGATIAVE